MPHRSEHDRAKVGIMREQGYTKAQIHSQTGFSRTFVDRWWDAGQDKKPFHDKPRCGRPRKLQTALQNKAVKLATDKQHMSWRQIAKTLLQK